MSELNLVAIREAMAARLRNINGVFVYEQWPGTAQQVPCLVIFPPDRIDYSKTFNRGTDESTWMLLALAGPMSPTAQRILEQLMSGTGSLSVIQCLGADRTLGGTVSTLKVPEANTGIFSVPMSGGTQNLIGVEFTVTVMG